MLSDEPNEDLKQQVADYVAVQRVVLEHAKQAMAIRADMRRQMLEALMVELDAWEYEDGE